jgi:hypothetical protein
MINNNSPLKENLEKDILMVRYFLHKKLIHSIHILLYIFVSKQQLRM